MTTGAVVVVKAALSRGFTLVELLVVMAIMAVLVSLAVPMFDDAALSNRLTGYANNFAASVQLARSESIKRNAAVKICSSANGTSCAASGEWQQGWIVFADNGAGANNNNGTVDSDETLLRYEQALASGYKFTSGANVYTLLLQPTGVGSTAQTLTLCKSAGKANRTLDLKTTGRLEITKGTASSC